MDMETEVAEGGVAHLAAPASILNYPLGCDTVWARLACVGNASPRSFRRLMPTTSLATFWLSPTISSRRRLLSTLLETPPPRARRFLVFWKGYAGTLGGAIVETLVPSSGAAAMPSEAQLPFRSRHRPSPTISRAPL